MSPDPHLRVGDREREQAAERLSAHAAAGRLTVEELEERLDRAQRAVTALDLERLEHDLPGPAVRRPPVPSGLWPSLPIAAAIVAAVVVGIAVVGHPFPPFFLVALLLWRFAWRPRWGWRAVR